MENESTTFLGPDEFSSIGVELVRGVAEHLRHLRASPVTPNFEDPFFTSDRWFANIPKNREGAKEVFSEVLDLFKRYATLNGHPRFNAYITSAPSPAGALADLIASSFGQNVALWRIAPLVTLIERQTLRWLGELIGLSPATEGIFLGGGEAANLACLHVAIRAQATDWDVLKDGNMPRNRPRPTVYATREAHRWLVRAVRLMGLGTDSIRWVETDGDLRMETNALRALIADDRRNDRWPFLILATAGTVGTGAVDPIRVLSEIAAEESVWLHVDGAYGATAACVEDVPEDLHQLARADSVTMDPQKWMYAPIPAACAFIRRSGLLQSTFSTRPSYYYPGVGVPEDLSRSKDHDDLAEFGPENSRPASALKVWVILRLLGTAGCREAVALDIANASYLARRVRDFKQLELGPTGLSIATFRYNPVRGLPHLDRQLPNTRLNVVNGSIADLLQRSGEYFISTAQLGDRLYLRACFVNPRTGQEDIDRLVQLAADHGDTLAEVPQSSPS